MKDKGRRDYTLNSTTRGPTKGVQFNRIMRHAVIDDIEEAGDLAGRADLGDDPVCRSGVAAAKARDADHRNV
jgi:hypothetical protein